MKVIELVDANGGGFRQTTRPDPVPGSGEVLVHLQAASLNYLDIAVSNGKYPLSQFPIIPVTDGAGVVAGVGSGVTRWKVGDRVVPHFIPGWADGRMPAQGGGPRRGIDLQGSLAEYVVVTESGLVATPEHLSDDEAATLPITATTAWRATRSLPIGPHSTVLVQGTGGVSLFCLQFAKAHGARVIVTSSDDDKLRFAAQLGADFGINYTSIPEWGDEVQRWTGGRGVDLTLETGGQQTMPQSIKAAALDSTIFIIGFLTGTQATIDVVPVMEKRIRLQGNNTGPTSDLVDAARTMAAHGIKPVLDRTYAIKDVAEAYERQQKGGFGKIVIDLKDWQ